jgi:Integrase core domain
MKVLSGPATRTILDREFRVFGKCQFERLGCLSVSHLYNLRKTMTYRQKLLVYTKTKGTKVTIGERRKPEPNGEPGYIRVDSVHQGDCPINGKGVYHINFVDEVTQWELVACVETISERHMTPVLTAALDQFPFVVINFHSDNGSEYINKVVARLLEKLRTEQTKSRPRKHNDNALVESKNGSVIRKHMGYDHIVRSDAPIINAYYLLWFNDYLNFHRPCAYGTVIRDHKGKEKIVYRAEDYMVPYEKLKSLPEATKYLKEGVRFDELDKTAYAMSDTDFARSMAEAKEQLFSSLKK